MDDHHDRDHLDELGERPPPPPSGLSTVLLVFAGIDLVLAFAMLVFGGFSWHFWAIAGIGVLLAVYGLKERLFPSTPVPE